MNNKLSKRILKYSLCYLVIITFITILFSYYNKSFVWVNVSFDGLDQHIVNLHLLKKILLGNFNTFFFNIGYGIDLFSNFTYYIFGDFPSFLILFFPDDMLEVAYKLIIFLRIYLVGFSFIIYTNNKNYRDESVVIGALLYTFSSYVLFAMARHPYFLNALIIFPILLLSVEKLVLQDKKIFFIIMVFILFTSSFYFGYMLSIIVLIYGIILAYNNYQDKKIIFKKVIMAILYAIVGIIMAAFLLIPTFEAFISSPRVGGNIYLYPLYYYPKLVASLISTTNTGNWSLIGVSSIILITLPIFMKDKKKNKVLFIFLIILFIPLVIPFIASIFDCLSFPNNRWAFVIPFILSLITIEVLEKKSNLNIKNTSIIIILYTLIIFLIRLDISIQELFSILFAFIFMYLISKNKKDYLLPIIVLSIISNFYFMYDKNFDSYITEFSDTDVISLLKTNNKKTPYLNDAIDYIKKKDNGFYNIMVYPNILNNLGLYNNYNSTAYFYSIISRNYYDLAMDLENQEMSLNGEIKTFNLRTRINELLNNKYLITDNYDFHPYGYEIIKNYNNETYILENKMNSSFVHLYTESINEDDYNNLSPLEKEEALLKYYIDDRESQINLSKVDNVSYTSNVFIDNKVFHKNNKDDKLSLKVNNFNNGELYLLIDNLQYKKGDITDIIHDNTYRIDVCLNKICLGEFEDSKYTTAYHIDNDNILINLGYYDSFDGEIEISFRDKGTYTFDNLKLLKVNFDNYKDIINNLNVLVNNVQTDENTLTFDADIKENGILSFATNYSKYFNVYIDNELVSTKTVNKYFLGCDIVKGNHNIKLVYKNTLIFKSFCVSIFGIIIFSVIMVLERKRKGVLYEKN